MSYDLAPPPSPYPHFPVSELDRLHIGRMRKRDNLLMGEGEEGMGEEPNHTTARESGPL